MREPSWTTPFIRRSGIGLLRYRLDCDIETCVLDPAIRSTPKRRQVLLAGSGLAVVLRCAFCAAGRNVGCGVSGLLITSARAPEALRSARGLLRTG